MAECGACKWPTGLLGFRHELVHRAQQSFGFAVIYGCTGIEEVAGSIPTRPTVESTDFPSDRFVAETDLVANREDFFLQMCADR
jgi:hypothetical protein